MKTFITAASLIASAAMTFAANADDRNEYRCGNVELDKWMSVEQLRDRAANMGIEVHEVGIDDGCYEVEGRNKDGRRIEVRFNPETGRQVSIDGDD